jgi:hypothetical protein
VKRPSGLTLVLAVLICWSLAFIVRGSFFIDGLRTYSLFDDAMISMTYARNLVEGHGLNWARWGQPVEGYSHPLWMALMIPVNLLPIALRFRSLVMQLLSLGFLVANVVATYRLALRHFSHPRKPLWVPATVLTAFYLPLVEWSLLGMESAPQAFLTTLAVGLALDVIAGRPRPVALLGCCAAAILLRPDMVFVVAVILGYVLRHRGFRRGHRRQWLVGAAVLVGSNLAYEIFRWRYFGDLLPNTYYLKLEHIPLEVRLLRGLSVLGDALRPVVALIIGLLIAAVPHVRRRPQLGLALGLPLISCVYSVYVGGDAWETGGVVANRFICFTIPLLFVALNQLLSDGLAYLEERRGGQAPLFPERFIVGPIVALFFLGWNGLWFYEREEVTWHTLLFAERGLDHKLLIEKAQQLADLRRVARPEALVAINWAGISGYFTDFRLIDGLGYNDRFIAHKQPYIRFDPENFGKFRPGHVKGDLDYVVQLHPDIVVQRDDPPGVYAGKKLEQMGYSSRHGFLVRNDSTLVLP